MALTKSDLNSINEIVGSSEKRLEDRLGKRIDTTVAASEERMTGRLNDSEERMTNRINDSEVRLTAEIQASANRVTEDITGVILDTQNIISSELEKHFKSPW